MAGNLLWETQPVSKSRNGERHEEVYKSRYAGAGLMFELQLLSVSYDTMPERSHVIVKASSKGVDYAQAEFYVVNDDWVMELPLWSPEADNAGLESALIEFADREVMKYAAGQARDRMGRFASGGTSSPQTAKEYAIDKIKDVKDNKPVTPWQDKWTTDSVATMTPLQKNAWKARATVALRKVHPDWDDAKIRAEVDMTLTVKEKSLEIKASNGVKVYTLKGDSKYTVETKITDDVLLDKFLGDVSDLQEYAPLPSGVKIVVKDGDNLGSNADGTSTSGSCNYPFEAEYATPVLVVYGENGLTVRTNAKFPYQLDGVEEVRRIGPQPMKYNAPIQINIPQGGIETGYSQVNATAVGTNIWRNGNWHMVGLSPAMTSTLAHEWGHAVDFKNGGYKPNAQGNQPYVSWLSYQSDNPKFIKLYRTYADKPLISSYVVQGRFPVKREGGLSDYALENRREGFAEIWSNKYLSQRFNFGTQKVTDEFFLYGMADN